MCSYITRSYLFAVERLNFILLFEGDKEINCGFVQSLLKHDHTISQLHVHTLNYQMDHLCTVVKIVTPCFIRLSLPCRSLVG